MSNETKLKGFGAAVPTLRDNDGVIDVRAHQRLTAVLADQGCEIVLVSGTTGGGKSLRHEERVQLARASFVLPVIVGVPRTITDAGLDDFAPHARAVLIAFGDDVPVDDALAMSARARVRGMELIAYHHPSHYPAMPASWYEPLARAAISVKNSDTDPVRLEAMKSAGLDVFIGATDRLGDVARWGTGVLSGIASTHFPDVRLAALGDVAALERLQQWEHSTMERTQTLTDEARRLIGE
ncbi:MAG: dihydrodipicolinate synthase family protein [Actinomycetota bacterium]